MTQRSSHVGSLDIMPGSGRSCETAKALLALSSKGGSQDIGTFPGGGQPWGLVNPDPSLREPAPIGGLSDVAQLEPCGSGLGAASNSGKAWGLGAFCGR